MTTTRVSFTKNFKTGTLAGLAVPVSFTAPTSQSLRERVERLLDACANGEVRKDVATGDTFTITDVRSVQE